MESRYLSVDACATYIGRTQDAIRGLVKRRQIPHVKIGRRVQFDKEAVDKWVQRHSKRGVVV